MAFAFPGGYHKLDSCKQQMSNRFTQIDKEICSRDGLSWKNGIVVQVGGCSVIERLDGFRHFKLGNHVKYNTHSCNVPDMITYP